MKYGSRKLWKKKCNFGYKIIKKTWSVVGEKNKYRKEKADILSVSARMSALVLYVVFYRPLLS